MERIPTRTNSLIKWLIIVGDYILFYAILGLYCVVFRQLDWSEEEMRMFYVATFTGLLVGQYRYSNIIHRRIVTPLDVLKRVTWLVIYVGVISYILIRLLRFQGTDGGLFLALVSVTYWVLLLGARYLERWILKLLRRKGKNSRTVVFLGNDPALDLIYDKLIKDSSTGYRFRGYYAEEKNPRLSATDRLLYLGTCEEMNKKLELGERDFGVDEIYCSLPHSQKPEILFLSNYCDNHLIRFFYVPLLEESFQLKLRPELLGEDMLVFSTFQMPLSLAGNRALKRSFDIVFSLIVLLITLPFYPLVALVIKLQSPGPVFFRQQRTGMNGKTFTIYKFRSMHVNDGADRVQATKDDPRKFPFGNFMRKTNIDELPQFFNVLKGDMGVVGPRPHMLMHTQLYSSLINKYMVRHFVKPGITGWAQVTGCRGETKELWQMENRVKRDIWYMEHWSLWLDLYIIALTFKSIFVHDRQAY